MKPDTSGEGLPAGGAGEGAVAGGSGGAAAPEVHVVGFYQVNCYLLHDGKGRAVCLDPGDDADLLLERLAARGARLEAILLTHAHWDHVGAVADLAEAHGAPVLLHEADVPLLAQWSPRPVRPARLLTDGDAVRAGGFAFRVLHTPGHTPGSLCFLLEAGEPWLFSGDTLFRGTVGRTDFPGGSAADLRRSLRTKLLPLPDATVVYPGHGDPTTMGRERRANPFLLEAAR